MPWYVKNTNTRVLGSSDLVPGIALLRDEPKTDEDYPWLGETDLDWDGQYTDRGDGDEPLFMTATYETVPESKIEWRPA